METLHPIQEIIKSNKSGSAFGIYSCCSANELVLRAAIERAVETNTYILIEATANQVNQFGGYTGMTPSDFYNYVQALAREYFLPAARLILGGDHLGPLTFADLPEAEAMQKSEDLVRCFVLAGFTKIHLDTSMKLLGDSKTEPLSDKVVAERGARLCAVCEKAYKELKKTKPDAREIVYVVGSEVPIPGGAQEKEDSVSVTKKVAAIATLESYRRSFDALGLSDAWSRVVGLVVQPGVEFGDERIFTYNREKTCALSSALDNFEGICFEAHSTDYQTKNALKALVEDGFSILKVGPALTFALREALFALDEIDTELSGREGFAPARFRERLEDEMRTAPSQWTHHYFGSIGEIEFKLAFSFSDRARYYLPKAGVTRAQKKLMSNLTAHEIPLALLSQYLPLQYTKVREGELENRAQALIMDKIKNCIDEYLFACSGV